MKIDTLYVRRNVVNNYDIMHWMIRNKFTSMQHPFDLHVTVAYSRKMLVWPEPKKRMLIYPRVETKLERLGELGKALVLTFDSEELRDDWQEFQDLGASWDWPDYNPHITITYQDQPNVNFETIESYSGPLILSDEVFEPLNTEFEPNEEVPLYPQYR
jgi:2'-5' RNA ligase